MLYHWIFSTLILGLLPLVLRILIFGFIDGFSFNDFSDNLDPIDFIVLIFIINSNIIYEKFSKKYIDSKLIELNEAIAIILCFISGGFLVFIFISEKIKFNYCKDSLLVFLFLTSIANIFLAGTMYYKIQYLENIKSKKGEQ